MATAAIVLAGCVLVACSGNAVRPPPDGSASGSPAGNATRSSTHTTPAAGSVITLAPLDVTLVDGHLLKAQLAIMVIGHPGPAITGPRTRQVLTSVLRGESIDSFSTSGSAVPVADQLTRAMRAAYPGKVAKVLVLSYITQ
jgi:hypothetical protein